MTKFPFQLGEKKLVLELSETGELVQNEAAEEVLACFNKEPAKTLQHILSVRPEHLELWLGQGKFLGQEE